MEAKANSLWKFRSLRLKALCRFRMKSEVPALSRRSVRESELPLLPATLSFKLQKTPLSCLICTEFLQSLISSRKTIRTTPTFNSRSKMINSQWKALHLGRWELLFKIMDEGSITRVADIENLQRSQLSRMVSGLEEELGVQLLERRGETSESHPSCT